MPPLLAELQAAWQPARFLVSGEAMAKQVDDHALNEAYVPKVTRMMAALSPSSSGLANGILNTGSPFLSVPNTTPGWNAVHCNRCFGDLTQWCIDCWQSGVVALVFDLQHAFVSDTADFVSMPWMGRCSASPSNRLADANAQSGRLKKHSGEANLNSLKLLKGARWNCEGILV
jgi:hypothetical protein